MEDVKEKQHASKKRKLKDGRAYVDSVDNEKNLESQFVVLETSNPKKRNVVLDVGSADAGIKQVNEPFFMNLPLVNMGSFTGAGHICVLKSGQIHVLDANSLTSALTSYNGADALRGTHLDGIKDPLYKIEDPFFYDAKISYFRTE